MKTHGGDVDKSSEESNEITNSQSGSQRSVRSSKKEDINDDSDSSSKNTISYNNQIHYTDQQQAELLRKLDSIKNHIIRVDKPKESDQSPIGFHGHGPSYYHPYPPEPFPYPIPVHGMYNPPQVAGYRDSYGIPIHKRPQNWYPGQYPNQIPRPYPPGQYVDIGPDILEPQLQDPRLLTPTRFGDQSYSPVSHHIEKTGPFVYNDSVSSSTVHGHTRLRSEIDSEIGSVFAQKPVLDTDARRCHPLAGGAPFIACDNCFELLYLPKTKLLGHHQQVQQKLECGACSEAISFTIVDKKLVFSSVMVETNQVSSVEVEDQSSSTVTDEKPVEKSRKEEVMKNIKKPVLSSEEDEERSSNVSNEQSKEVIKSVRRRDKVMKSPDPPAENSNLLELFEYSNVNRAALAYGMKQLGYNKQESYMKQDSLATETEVSYNGYSNTEISEDSRKEEMRKEEKEYSFSEITNRVSYEEQTQSLEVWVNGCLIPEDLVIKAEKQAGPVQAGKYWYDYRAGFWGVMGNPCLGIIPPFIEEFSRPMPDNCGAGNTGVIVNGRELHERDLELLARRGLPREKNRSYIIDISGRVLDGDSGEELECLGKLAPTIEKVKHGFGMRVPRSLVS